MGIYDFMGNGTADEFDSVSDQQNENDGSFFKDIPMALVKKTIQGSGELFRKLYSAKIDVVNDFSDIKPDWSFIDSGSVRDEIERLDKVIEFEKNKYKNEKTQENLQNVIRAIKQQIIVYSLLPDGIEVAINKVEEYGFNDPFATHGLECLQAIAADDENTAKAAAKNYFIANGGNIEHPLVGLYVATSFFEDEKYEIVIDLLKKVVVAYPDWTIIHQMLRDSHKMLGHEKAAAVEEEIIQLLNEGEDEND